MSQNSSRKIFINWYPAALVLAPWPCTAHCGVSRAQLVFSPDSAPWHETAVWKAFQDGWNESEPRWIVRVNTGLVESDRADTSSRPYPSIWTGDWWHCLSGSRHSGRIPSQKTYQCNWSTGWCTRASWMATYLAPLSMWESCKWWCYKVRITTKSLAVVGLIGNVDTLSSHWRVVIQLFRVIIYDSCRQMWLQFGSWNISSESRMIITFLRISYV